MTRLALGLGLGIATVVAFAGVTELGFLGFDDDKFVTSNAQVANGLTLEGVSWALRATVASNWHPLTLISHMLDVEFFGIEPAWHHTTSLVFHVANALLLFGLLEYMTGSQSRSAFVAALFALHPLHVESVAWVSERKDVLCAFFWFASTWAYAVYVKAGSRAAYGAALLLFASGLMSKPMAVTLPFTLLIFDVWPLGRVQGLRGDVLRRALIDKLPFLALSAIFGFVTLAIQRASGAAWTAEVLPLSYRLGNAAVAYVRYLGKTFWPVDLSIFYPHPGAWPAGTVVGAALVLLVVTALVLASLRRRPYLACGWFFFLGTLVPTIGLVQAGNQSMADRYTYVPLIGVFIALTWGTADVLGRARWARATTTVLAAAILLGCGVVTRSYVPKFVDTLTLFSHALEHTQENSTAHNTVGRQLVLRGQTEAALEHYREALRIHPYYALARYNLGAALLDQGRHEEAITHLALAAALPRPRPSMYHLLGRAHHESGRLREAVASYQAALQLKPTLASTRSLLGKALLSLGEIDAAIAELREAIRSPHPQPRAHDNLGWALEQKGQLFQAVAHYEKTLEYAPEARRSLRRLAWISAASVELELRNASRALELAQRANQQSGSEDASDLGTLAAALAANERFAEAAATARRAAERTAGPEADALKARARLYESGQALHFSTEQWRP